MCGFKAGFARLDVTPPFGIFMQGYYEERRADGILDPLYASALAVSDGERTAVVFSLDAIGINQQVCDECRGVIAIKTALPIEAVFIACTHTHTGPVIYDSLFKRDPVYNQILFGRMADTAVLAIRDMRAAEVHIGRNQVKDISFIRRYRMKDGSIRTNPGINNPEILAPIGTPDETVQLVSLKRKDAPDILLVNFQVHPDIIGGTWFSADYPKFVRDTLENALDSVRCIFFNGAQGDTNHINVNTTPDKANGGYEHSKHMGRAIAGAILQIYGKTERVQDGTVGFIQKNIEVPSNKGTAARVSDAEKIIALHEAGRDSEIPFVGMELITSVAEAHRIKRLEHAPDAFALHLTAVRFGCVAISGIPGEPFTDIGRAIKENSPFDMTFVCCCANGCEGYYPMRSAYDEGGYEARSSSFKAGVAELLIENSVKMLGELR